MYILVYIYNNSVSFFLLLQSMQRIRQPTASGTIDDTGKLMLIKKSEPFVLGFLLLRSLV